MEARRPKRPFDDRIVSHLRRSIFGANAGLSDVPEMLKTVIEQEIWRERIVEETGEVVHFERFEEFVVAPPLEGLGASVRQLKQLCQDDPGALSALDQATSDNHGGDRRSESFKDDNITLETAEKATQGTSSAYALRRLRKDRSDLHERVLAGELSPHAAMVEAGFRKKTFAVPDDVEGAARTLLKHFDPDRLIEAIKEKKGG